MYVVHYFFIIPNYNNYTYDKHLSLWVYMKLAILKRQNPKICTRTEKLQI